MYENTLHLYNGLDHEPDPQEVAEHVMGAVFGFVVGSTLGYSWMNRDISLTPSSVEYLGGGPERLKPGELNQVTNQSLLILREAIQPIPNFGQRVLDILPINGPSTTDVMESSFRFQLLSQDPAWDTTLALAIGPTLLGHPHKALTVARMVQNSPVVDAVLWDFQMVMKDALLNHRVRQDRQYYGGHISQYMSQNGKITSTLNNAILYGASELSFERVMCLVCGRGGKASVAAGIAGAVVGARDGFQSIPKKYIDGLRETKEWVKGLSVAAAGAITGV